MIVLSQLRTDHKLTMDQMATIIGTTRQTYSRIEKGESTLSISQAVTLVDRFDLTLDQLIDADLQCASPSPQDFNWDKYVQIIKNFIYHAGGSDGKIPKTKLAKLCYLFDFGRYYDHMCSITGLEYRRIQQGPVPDTYFAALESLESQESINIEYSGRAHMISNITPPDTNLLSEEEMLFLTKIAHKRALADTATIVDFTHNQLPWKLCDDKELIPYELIIQEDPDHVY